MALDGIVVSNIVAELNANLGGARIAKIAQPEADELLLTLKSPNSGPGPATALSKREPSADLFHFGQ